MSGSDHNDVMNSWLQVDIGRVDEIDDDDDADEQSQRFFSLDFEIGTAPSYSTGNSPQFRNFPVDESYFARSPRSEEEQLLRENEGGKHKTTEPIESPSISTCFEKGSGSISLDRMDPTDVWTTVANLSVGQSKRKWGRSAEIPVELHEHEGTGLRVCFVDSHGPLVRTYFCIATESVSTEYWQKDDGIPHILEHLTTVWPLFCFYRPQSNVSASFFFALFCLEPSVWL